MYNPSQSNIVLISIPCFDKVATTQEVGMSKNLNLIYLFLRNKCKLKILQHIASKKFSELIFHIAFAHFY